MKIPCSGIILAGGLNKRFGGKNKAFIHCGGKRILDRVYDVLQTLFDEIILVTNDPIPYLEWDLKIVADLFPFRSSLTGIHAGLFYATNPFAFVTACDTPFLKKALVQKILDETDPKADLTIPETKAGLEPLCAVYSKKTLNKIEPYLIQEKVKIIRVFGTKRVKKIPENLLRQADPDLVSFFNINAPDDLKEAEEIAANELLIDSRETNTGLN